MVYENQLTNDEIAWALYECKLKSHSFLTNKQEETKASLAQLREDKIVTMAERNEASLQGDLSENAEYHNATDKLQKITKDIALCEYKLRAFEEYATIMGMRDEIPESDGDITLPLRVLDESTYRVPKNWSEPINAETDFLCDIGKTVCISLAGGSTYTWTLAPSELADNEASLLSYESPVGKCLIGRQVGYNFTIVIKGKPLTYTLKGVL